MVKVEKKMLFSQGVESGSTDFDTSAMYMVRFEETPFWHDLILKYIYLEYFSIKSYIHSRNICQDRLGINIGKVETGTRFCRRVGTCRRITAMRSIFTALASRSLTEGTARSTAGGTTAASDASPRGA